MYSIDLSVCAFDSSLFVILFIRVQMYKGKPSELGKADQFVFHIGTIGRVMDRVEAMRFKIDFDENFKKVEADIETQSQACEEVKGSQKFKSLLKYCLLIGNKLNEGSSKGGASGFTLKALQKFTITKNNKGARIHLLFIQLALVFQRSHTNKNARYDRA